MKTRNYHQGKYTMTNPEKYIGDVDNIIYRSSWELKLLKWADNNPSIIKMSSEELVIPYVNPFDNKIHRYFPDLFIEAKTTKGDIQKVVIEIKPYAQTQKPIASKKATRRLLNETITYGINKSKWQSAEAFCKKNGWKFVIMTEKDLF